MKKDPLDLPRRSVPAPRDPEVLKPQRERRELTGKQREMVIQAGRETIQLARDIVEVLAIHERGAATVKQIEAETRKIETVVLAEVARLEQEQGLVRERGQVAVGLLDQLLRSLESIPEVDSASRAALIQAMPPIIESVVGRK